MRTFFNETCRWCADEYGISMKRDMVLAESGPRNLEWTIFEKLIIGCHPLEISEASSRFENIVSNNSAHDGLGSISILPGAKLGIWTGDYFV